MPTTESIKTLEFLGALALAGGVGFALLIWLPASRLLVMPAPLAGQWLCRLLRWSTGAGAAALIGFAALDLLGLARAAADQPLAMAGWDFVAAVANGTRYGRLALVRMGLGLGCLLLLALPDRRRVRGVPVHVMLLAPAALGVLLTFSLSSHAAATVGRGPWPLLADLVHLLAVAAWVGGLAFLALLPWRRLATSYAGLHLLRLVTGRFAGLALAAVAMLAGSGLYLASLRVYGPRALVETDYGTALLVKGILFAGLVTAAGANRLWLLPALRSGRPDPERTAGWLHRVIAAEAVLAVAAVAFAADLTVLSPVADPPVRIRVAVAADGFHPAAFTVPLGRRVRLQLDNATDAPARLVLRDFEHRLDQGPGLLPHRELLIFAPPTDKLWLDVAARRQAVVEFTPLREGTYALESGATPGARTGGWITVRTDAAS